ncbi:MAG: hypothetical protein D6714_12515, partial [Bacteroidetes bacterium]
QTTATATGLCAGTYTVTVNDASGCPQVDTVIVEQAPSQIELETSSTPASCDGTCDGTATVTVISGVAPYTYQWDSNAGNQTTATATGLCAGTYTVTVNDANGCPQVDTVIVEQAPSQIELETSSTPASCGACDGTATVTVLSGMPPYTYQWDSNAGNQTTATATGLCAGTYTVTVNDANNCPKTDTVVVEENTSLTILVKATDATCHNSNDGCIEIQTIFPDTHPPFDIQWSTGATDSVICGLAPGDYSVTVTDALGCSGMAQVSVGFESSIMADIAWKVDTCLGDSLVVSFWDTSIPDPPTDAAVGWEWIFSSGDTAYTSVVQLTIPAAPLDVFFVVENAAGCKDTLSQTVIFDGPSCVFSPQDTTVCLGQPLIVSASCSADSTLTYLWTPDSLILSGGNTSSASLNTDMPGTFTVFLVTESDLGCGKTDSVQYTVVDTALASIDTSLISFTQSCDSLYMVCFENENDSLVNQNYVWYFDYPNPGNSVSGFDGGCFSYPGAGHYTIALMPKAACLDTFFMEVEVKDAMQALFGFEVGDCSDTVDVNFNDMSFPGDQILSWNWDFGNGDTSDLQNPKFSVTDSTQVFNVLLEVKFTNGCIQRDSHEVVVRIFTPQSFMDTVVACGPGMEVELNPTGFLGYEYHWTPGQFLSDSTIWNPVATVNDTTTFNVVVDSLDCSVERAVTVVFAEPFQLNLMPDSVVVCETMDTVLVAQTNLADLNYAWFDAYPFTDTLSTDPTMSVEAGAPKTYYVEVTNEYGCPQQDSILVGNYEIALDVPDQLDICKGDSIDFEIEGLQDDYTVVWTAFDPQGYVPDTSMNFELIVTNPQNCFSKSELFVNFVDMEALINVRPALDTIVKGQRVQLTALDNPGFIYDWDNEHFLSADGIPDPIATPDETVTFTLSVEDMETGCRGSNTSTICVISDLCDYPMIFFPTAFTPNGDNVNDVLYVEGFNIDEVFWVVYNRWGEKVFESHAQEEGWDGTFNGEPAEGDVFAYYLRVRCVEGGEFVKKGNVTIIR